MADLILKDIEKLDEEDQSILLLNQIYNANTYVI